MFARRDYQGLSQEGQRNLREFRSKVAKDLLSDRKDDLTESSLERRNKWYEIDLDSAESRARRKRRREEEADKLYGRKEKESQESIKHHQELADALRKKKNLKRAGAIAGGVALTAGALYGGKKIYDHYKKKDSEDKD